MKQACSLFEGLDLLDLWHLYGQINRAASARGVSISKVSRRSHELLAQLGLPCENSRGLPSGEDLCKAQALRYLRLAFQQWRFDQGLLKVLPTFTTMAAAQGLDGLDVLPDVSLRADQIRDHLLQRRIDLVLSSTLDLAGELIEEAEHNPQSRFAALPLYRDGLMVGLNPQHPLAGMACAQAEDCREFQSPAYPVDVAPVAAAELRCRGLWRSPVRKTWFDPKEWILGMRSTSGLCYVSAMLLNSVRPTRDLALVPFKEPLRQLTAVVMLRELVDHPRISKDLGAMQHKVASLLQQGDYAPDLLA
jgi:DNA-binding transcriptional LysR family regulator